MNGVTLSILKVDMDENPKGAKPYNVDIKGYPTLYTFVEENGKIGRKQRRTTETTTKVTLM